METPNWLFENRETILQAIITAIAILSILLGLVRLFGLRSFAKFTPIVFAVTVCIGSVLSAVIMNDSTSLLKGGIIIATLLAFQAFYGFIKIYLPKNLSRGLTNDPLYLFKDGDILEDNLKKSQMTLDQLHSKIRMKGYGSFRSINCIILESTGDIAIISADKKIDEEVFREVRC